MNKMIVANLIHRPVRTLISIIAIGVEVTLILLIVGLSLGMLNDAKERQVGIGADVMVSPPGSSFLSGISGAPAPIKIADVIRKLPHVVAVAPVITQTSVGTSLEVIYGIDLKSFTNLSGPFHYIEGGPFQGPDSAIVDDIYATQAKVHVGDKIKILNHMVTVSGIVQHGKGARKYLPLATLQDWIGAQGKATMFYVKADNPKNASLIESEIKHVPGMENYVTRSIQQYISMMTAQNLPGLSTFLDVVIAIAVIIGFIVIFQAMYAAVMERTREIGILKSLGASKFYIINAILRETVLLAILGIIVGFIFSYAAQAGITARFPTLTITIIPGWLWKATLIAIGGAILGAIYPAYKAAAKDPIDALAYE